MENAVDEFFYSHLGSGKDQYDSFYDFRSQQLDLALLNLVQNSIATSNKVTRLKKKILFLQDSGESEHIAA